jgi:ligand-binding sensor domain-containing protein
MPFNKKIYLSSILPYWVHILLFFITLDLFSQNIPVGTWRTHAAYNQAYSVADAGDKIYCGTSGGLFYYDKTDNSLQIISKLDGLSETDISKLKYDSSTGILVICYSNGNIDLLQNNNIKNLNFIKQSTALPDKKLNHILIADKIAYMAYNFGVVMLDLNRQEIKETWRNLGTNGSSLSVYGSTIVEDSIFLGTSQGVLVAKRTANLQDFNSWKILGTANGLPAGSSIKALASNGKNLFAGIENQGIFQYQNGKFVKLAITADFQTINNLQFSGNQLAILLPKKILIQAETNTFSELTSTLLVNPKEIITDGSKRWIADTEFGLVSNENTDYQYFLPGSPYRKEVFQLYTYDEKIVASAGSYNFTTPAGSQAGYYIFEDGSWKNYNKNESKSEQKIPDIKDIVASAYANQKLYLASFGNGLLVSKPDGTFQIFNQTNSSLKPFSGTANSVRITDLETDDEENVWILNFGVNTGQPVLHELKPDGTFLSFTLPQTLAAYATDLLIDANGYKWMLISPGYGGGILVYDEKTGKSRYLQSGADKGGLPDQTVNAMTMDADGAIWVGTNRGVAVFYNTSQIFESTTTAVLPVFENSYLLREEIVTSLTIDGGNRKWIGTQTGAWLFSSDGTQKVNYFNTENSPLPSNVVKSIAIQPVSGEIFVATDQGIVSYRGTATASEGTNKNVKIFPNPVRPGFDGVISISGLATNANVKITDVSGRLVYQTQANGGTAVWNVQDYKNRRAKSGIYLIFSTLPEGTEGFAGKVLIIE